MSLLGLGTKSVLIPGPEVVAVRHKMDEAVEHHSEVDVTIREGVCVQPIDQENGEVVVHVQEGNLTPIALHNHEQGVEEVEHLGEVEHMQHNCHARFSASSSRR